MKRERITFLEKVLIHSVDLPEAIIKLVKHRPETPCYIYQKHEIRYEAMLKMARKYKGNIPKELREKILSCAKPCTRVRYYTARIKARTELKPN